MGNFLFNRVNAEHTQRNLYLWALLHRSGWSAGNGDKSHNAFEGWICPRRWPYDSLVFAIGHIRQTSAIGVSVHYAQTNFLCGRPTSAHCTAPHLALAMVQRFAI
jgi:hypothetical protein